MLEQLAERVGTEVVPRPNGVKSLERYVEKDLEYDLIPLDILAAKFVFPDLGRLYTAAGHVGEVFEVLGFRDRSMQPRASGDRDLQFVVDVEGHAAEVKLCLADFDELDVYEHRLYEMRRTLESKEALTEVDTLVLDRLNAVSAELFEEVWARVLRKAGE